VPADLAGTWDYRLLSTGNGKAVTALSPESLTVTSGLRSRLLDVQRSQRGVAVADATP
jgi:hypothetical protein